MTGVQTCALPISIWRDAERFAHKTHKHQVRPKKYGVAAFHIEADIRGIPHVAIERVDCGDVDVDIAAPWRDESITAEKDHENAKPGEQDSPLNRPSIKSFQEHPEFKYSSA